MQTFKILFIGEIVGSSGVFTVKTLLPGIKEELGVDLVVANADGATGGFGIGKSHAVYLHKLGVDVITTGEGTYYKKDMVPHIAGARYMVRPCNYPWDNPGRGWIFGAKGDLRYGVISVLGQSGFNRVHLANPYHVLPPAIERVKKEAPVVIVDFHAATTAEKNTLFRFLRGQVTAVVGTHQRVATGDERVEDGTAYQTELGRTGSAASVNGLEPEPEIRQLITQVPEQSKIAWESLELQGALIETDADGSAVSISRIRRECKEKPNARKGDRKEHA